jgi:hypothetical protein
MFDPSSRYFGLETVTFEVTIEDGTRRQIKYVKRRFPPSSSAMTTLLEVHVAEGDRLDNITGRYLGDATQFWRIADANDAMRPTDLTDTVGGVVKIALPAL